MSELIVAVSNRVRLLKTSTLYMNAMYLMLSTLVVAASGFVFWVLVARQYEAATVGLATTIISISNLLALLSLAGFDTTLVRFLPRAKHKNVYLGTAITMVVLTSTLLSLTAVLLLPILIPNLVLLHHPLTAAAFIFFTAITALSTLANAVFLANRRTYFVLLAGGLVSIVKVIAPLLLAGGDAMTIFVLMGLAQLAGLSFSLFCIRQRFNYRLWPRLSRQLLRARGRFSAAMYASSMLNLLPPTLLPLILLSSMGPASAAFYYMAFTIASVLYTIAYATTQSAFAEGSHNEAALAEHIKKAGTLVGLLLVPAAILIALGSGLLLATFGKQYAHQGAGLLQLFALGAIPVAVYSALGAIFKVTKQLRATVVMNVVYVVVIVGFSYVFVPVWGLPAIGIAWLAGNITACFVGVRFIVKHKKLRRE